MTSVSPMASMHEDVHERASENEKIWDGAEDVGSVFLPQQDQRDSSKAEEDQEGPRPPEATRRRAASVVM